VLVSVLQVISKVMTGLLKWVSVGLAVEVVPLAPKTLCERFAF
jgi:hypothetical protein